MAEKAELFRRQGFVVATWRRRGAKNYGPYYRLSYRERGRQCSIYLGREGPLVEGVREGLAGLRASVWWERIWARRRRQIASILRISRQRVDKELGPMGLRLKGYEVRGWRTSPFRSILRDSLRGFARVAGASRMRMPSLGLGWPAMPRLPGLPNLWSPPAAVPRPPGP